MTTTLTKVGTSFGTTPCPCCSATRGNAVEVNGRLAHGLYLCEGCGGLLGSCYRGDSPVLMVFGEDGDESRYFDLDLLGSDGISRVHGFYNPATMKVVQFG